MRFNNQHVRQFVASAYFVFVVALFLSAFSFSYVSKIITNAGYKYLFLFAILITSFLLIHKLARYFEYDSDGTVLVIINRGLFLSEFFNYRENKAEFPKKKLLNYKIKNYGIYKTLDLYIQGKKTQKRLRFNITLITNKKIKYLKQSLDKVLRQNKQNS